MTDLDDETKKVAHKEAIAAKKQ